MLKIVTKLFHILSKAKIFFAFISMLSQINSDLYKVSKIFFSFDFYKLLVDFFIFFLPINYEKLSIYLANFFSILFIFFNLNCFNRIKIFSINWIIIIIYLFFQEINSKLFILVLLCIE